MKILSRIFEANRGLVLITGLGRLHLLFLILPDFLNGFQNEADLPGGSLFQLVIGNGTLVGVAYFGKVFDGIVFRCLLGFDVFEGFFGGFESCGVKKKSFWMSSSILVLFSLPHPAHLYVMELLP